MELDIEVTNSDLTLTEPWFGSDTSSGYLEDAITGIWCKQHNLPHYSQNQKKSQYMVDEEDLFPAFSSTTAHLLQDHKQFSTRNLSSSSQNHKHAAAIKPNSSQRSCASRESNENDASNSILKGQWKIAYPFELVKPGGVEGETTLKDINHQMLMNPSKPIPHPVAMGDSVTVTHPNRGYGISGKAVAGLTRIHTQGRGSITIIRTKG